MQLRLKDWRDPALFRSHVEGVGYFAGIWRIEQESARSEGQGAAIYHGGPPENVQCSRE